MKKFLFSNMIFLLANQFRKAPNRIRLFFRGASKIAKINDKPNKHNRRIGNRKKSRSDLSLPADYCSCSYALGQIL
ncbi:hypothetical protein [Leptospira weilii]|uniref:hypothetical protein n=1 Tax=Leptospira weilii TaxID=28184 RepID=UPI001EF18428|nr:hypothetical protein [Leptospira weilii]